jgi:hypothetical protein
MFTLEFFSVLAPFFSILMAGAAAGSTPAQRHSF